MSSSLSRSGPAVAMQAAETFLANGGEVIIRMRGLPFDATVQDIVSVIIIRTNKNNM